VEPASGPAAVVKPLSHVRIGAALRVDLAAPGKLLDTTKPTAAKAIGVLEQIGILRETTGRRRDRTFSYAGYLDRLRAGTDLEE